MNDNLSPEEPPESGPQAEGERWRPRRPSPLGLMGSAESESPKESGWPSLRAAGIMAVFMAAVIAAVLLFSRGC